MNRRNASFPILRGVASCLLAVWLGSTIGCHKATDPWKDVEGGNLRVLVTFPPLYCFTHAVAGKDAKVVSMLTATGPHEHKPQADDAQLAAGADLFLANGLGLDDFVPQVATIAGNKKIKIVKLAEAIPPADRIKVVEDEHDHHEGHEDHHHGEWDPHVWLGIEQAILMVQKIGATLKEADAAHAGGYDQRAAAYVEKLKKLHADGKKLLETKKNRKIVATHESLAYFCKSFDLDMVGSIMPMAGVDADSVQMSKLEKLCKDQGVCVIAIEPQFSGSRKDAEILQKALEKKGHKLVIVEIDPIETAPVDQLLDGDYYFTKMRQNLDNLAKNLE